MGKPELVRDRYPQDFVQECCRTWITRSTTDDQVVLSLHESGRYTAHSNAKDWGHGDGLIHLGGMKFAIGTQYEVLPFEVRVDGAHIYTDEFPRFKVAGASQDKNIILGNGFGRLVLLTKYPDTTNRRIRTVDQAKFFSGQVNSSADYDSDWNIDQGAVQGVGFIDANTVVVISGGAGVDPRVKTYDAMTGAELSFTRMDVSHIEGTGVEAEGYDQGKTMIAYEHTGTGNVRFDVMPAL